MTLKVYPMRPLPYVWADREVLMWRALRRAVAAEAQGKEHRRHGKEAISWMPTSMRRYILLHIYDDIQQDPSAVERYFPNGLSKLK